MFYFFSYLLFAASLIFVILLLVNIACLFKKHQTVGIKIQKCLVCGIISLVIISSWLCSHRSCPMINDWDFLGKNIYSVEEKYKNFRLFSVRDDGSGKAVLMTEDIIGRSMYDAGDYSCYFMEFDQDGIIIKVYCGRPIGG